MRELNDVLYDFITEKRKTRDWNGIHWNFNRTQSNATESSLIEFDHRNWAVALSSGKIKLSKKIKQRLDILISSSVDLVRSACVSEAAFATKQLEYGFDQMS